VVVMVAHHVVVMMHHVVVTHVVVHRMGRGEAGRHGQGDGRGERQGDEFQGSPSQLGYSPESAFGHRPCGASSLFP
jgi:hypothetical protein